MKKFLIALTALCLTMSPAMAIGRVIQDGYVQPTAVPVEQLPKLEVSEYIGKTYDEYTVFKESNPDYSGFPFAYTSEVVNDSGETVKMISQFADHFVEDGQQSDFSIIGYSIGQKVGHGISEIMAENGWEEISKWYEGGTLDFTFEKTEGGATYTLRLWSNIDRGGEIRLIDLKVDDIAAHIANAEAGLNLMPVGFPAE